MLKELNEIKDKLIELHSHVRNIYDTDIEIYDKHSLIFNENCSAKIFNLCEKIGIDFNYSGYNGSSENNVNCFVSTFSEVITYLEELPKSENIPPENGSNVKEKILLLAFELNQIYDSKLKPEDKYEMIFNDLGNKKISEYLSELNLRMEYYDPDTSYDEDVQAYMSALNDRVGVINKVFKRKI